MSCRLGKPRGAACSRAVTSELPVPLNSRTGRQRRIIRVTSRTRNASSTAPSTSHAVLAGSGRARMAAYPSGRSTIQATDLTYLLEWRSSGVNLACNQAGWCQTNVSTSNASGTTRSRSSRMPRSRADFCPSMSTCISLSMGVFSAQISAVARSNRSRVTPVLWRQFRGRIIRASLSDWPNDRQPGRAVEGADVPLKHLNGRQTVGRKPLSPYALFAKVSGQLPGPRGQTKIGRIL